MTDQEKVERLPAGLQTYGKMLLGKQLTEMPQQPEKGKWYRLYAEGTFCAFDEPYHACFKSGIENKLLIIFCGGGVSINAYTAAHPNSVFNPPGAVNFYTDDVFLVADLVPPHGLGADRADNPFRNWSALFVPYATGDFHCGENDFSFRDDAGAEKVVHHRGYTNYRALIAKIQRYVPSPEQIVVTGFSAGAFATALLTDDVMDRFPDCRDVTCFPDSAQLLYRGWRETAEKVWKAPKAISERLTGDNITLDSLLALHRKRGDSVKIMYACSCRDNMLSAYQHYIDFGEMTGATQEDGVTFSRRYAEMARVLRQQIPGIGLFICDLPAEGDDAEKHLTKHCINMSDEVYTCMVDGVRCIDWIEQCTRGEMMQLGLSLLNIE